MNTVTAGSPNIQKSSSYSKSQAPEKPDSPSIRPESNAKNAAQVKNEKSKANLNQKADSKVNDEKKKDQLDIDNYLKIVSRLESKLNKGELGDEDIEKISKSLEEKILSLNEAQKKRLRKMEFFKKHGIENIKEFKKNLIEMFNDATQREELFMFLKSPGFMTTLLSENNKPITYSPDTIGIAAKAPKV